MGGTVRELTDSVVAGTSSSRYAVPLFWPDPNTGIGFQGETQSGVGLANVRERLLSLYGTATNLCIEGREPSGTRISFRVPLAAGGKS